MSGEDEGFFRYMVGAYYYDEKISPNNAFNTGSLLSIQNDKSVSTESWAAFTRVTLAPSEELRFVLGARYTEDKKATKATNSTWQWLCQDFTSGPDHEGCFNIPDLTSRIPMPTHSTTDEEVIAKFGLIPFGGPVWGSTLDPAAPGDTFIVINNNVSIDSEINEEKVTWRAGVEYDVAADSLLYASVETGYHAGGFSLHTDRPTFEPEEITAYTIGSKNRFLDGSMQVNLEAFYWTYDNQQLTHFAVQSNGGQAFVTDNAGKSTNKGVELSVLYRVLRNTTLKADIQYLDAKYDEFTYESPVAINSPALITGCDVPQTTPTAVRENVTVDCSGKDALHAPMWTLNLGVEQVFPIGNLELIANLDTHYQSENVIGFEMLNDLSVQESYWMSNASLTLLSPADGWAITAFINNIEDERPLGNAFLNASTLTLAGSPLPPRLYGLRARLDF